ncbi:MAG: hypothetical protein ACK58T_12495 [Phycisphaerae bacterium]
MFAKPVKRHASEKSSGDDAVGINIVQQEWNGSGTDGFNLLNSHSFDSESSRNEFCRTGATIPRAK